MLFRAMLWATFVVTCMAEAPAEVSDAAPLQWLHDCSSCDRARSKVLRWTIAGNDAFSQTCMQRCMEDPKCTHVQVKPDQWGAGCFLYEGCIPVPNSCDEWHVYEKPVVETQNLVVETQNLGDIGRCPTLDCGRHCTVKYDFFDRLIQGKATFSCESGYVLSGEASLTCELKIDVGYATWSGKPPRCLDQRRTTTPSPHHDPHIVFVGNGNCAGKEGHWDAKDFVHIPDVGQNVCEAACIGEGDRCTGYSYERDEEQRCFLWREAITHASGSYRLQCHAKASCPPIDSCGPNCLIDGSGAPVMLEGDKLLFRCDPGYHLVGDSDTLCVWTDAKAQWSSPAPHCVARPKPCRRKTDCPVGKRCHDGRCVPTEDPGLDTCVPLPGGHHLTVTYSGDGLSATYRCAAGYTLTSDERATRQCNTATRSWEPVDAPAPLCAKEGMLALGRGKCVNKQAHWSHHEYVHVSDIGSSPECERRCAQDWRCHGCSFGYSLQDCYLWHAPVVRADHAAGYQCLEKYACKSIHGTHMRVKYSHPHHVEGLEWHSPLSAGTVATFTCTSWHYELSDKNPRRCLGDTWDAPLPTCDPLGDFRRVGQGQCRSGHHEWRPSEEIRTRGQCADSCLHNKRCTGYSSANEYTCVQYLDYVVDRAVAEDGSKCFAKKMPQGCPPLDEHDEHGEWETRLPGDRPVGTVVHLKCDRNYRPTHFGIAQCNLDLAWEARAGGDFPFCESTISLLAGEKERCESLPQDNHGHWNLISGEYVAGSVAELECQENFRATGTAHLTCNAEGKWSLPADEFKMPVCEECKAQRFDVASGNCVADKNGCVWSRTGDCKFVPRIDGILKAKEWRVVGASLTAHGARFTSENSPEGLTFFKGEAFNWRASQADGSSFEICWSNLEEYNAFIVTSGACIVDDVCVSSPHYPFPTTTHEEGCTIKAYRGGTLRTDDVSESAAKNLYLEGDDGAKLGGKEIDAGAIITWRHHPGSKWKLCNDASPMDVIITVVFVVVLLVGIISAVAWIAAFAPA